MEAVGEFVGDFGLEMELLVSNGLGGEMKKQKERGNEAGFEVIVGQMAEDGDDDVNLM